MSFRHNVLFFPWISWFFLCRKVLQSPIFLGLFKLAQNYTDAFRAYLRLQKIKLIFFEFFQANKKSNSCFLSFIWSQKVDPSWIFRGLTTPLKINIKWESQFSLKGNCIRKANFQLKQTLCVHISLTYHRKSLLCPLCIPLKK